MGGAMRVIFCRCLEFVGSHCRAPLQRYISPGRICGLDGAGSYGDSGLGTALTDQRKL